MEIRCFTAQITIFTLSLKHITSYLFCCRAAGDEKYATPSSRSECPLETSPRASKLHLIQRNACQKQKMVLKCLTFIEQWFGIRCLRVILFL